MHFCVLSTHEKAGSALLHFTSIILYGRGTGHLTLENSNVPC